jgi:NAD(P)-dependent dehydrogenase (short-subunit alcohol dehydrogenase family)
VIKERHVLDRSSGDPQSGQFADKTVVITGGTLGIGLATAHAFAEQGARVVVIGTNTRHLSDAYDQLTSRGVAVAAIKADVSDAKEVALAANEAVARFGPPDVLVNSAGILRFGGTLDTTEDDWDAIIDVDLKGTWMSSRAFIPHLLGRPGASIVNVASNAGLRGIPNLLGYCAAKGGIIAMTRAMALEFAPRGLRVNCVAPGYIRTPMGQDAAARLGLTEAGIKAQYPIGRAGDAREVASVIRFLSSDDSAFVTGAIVSVDGGNVA